MKKKKAIKKLLMKIEMQNRKMLRDIEFIRQNIPVSIPFVTTTDTTTIQEGFPNWKCLGIEHDVVKP